MARPEENSVRGALMGAAVGGFSWEKPRNAKNMMNKKVTTAIFFIISYPCFIKDILIEDSVQYFFIFE
jgi:hypothetical protein